MSQTNVFLSSGGEGCRFQNKVEGERVRDRTVNCKGTAIGNIVIIDGAGFPFFQLNIMQNLVQIY